MPNDAPQLFVALLHFPVYNKAREIVATSLTTLNLHDLARLTATYGTSGCYVVTPLQRQRELARQMIAHWTQGYGATYNPTRAEALQHMHVAEHLEAVEQDIVQRCGVAPRLLLQMRVGFRSVFPIGHCGRLSGSNAMLFFYSWGQAGAWRKK